MNPAHIPLHTRPLLPISVHGCWRAMMTALIVIIVTSASVQADSNSSWKCPGFEPAAPPGCRGAPRCLCDADGSRCGWVFDCGSER